MVFPGAGAPEVRGRIRPGGLCLDTRCRRGYSGSGGPFRVQGGSDQPLIVAALGHSTPTSMRWPITTLYSVSQFWRLSPEQQPFRRLSRSVFHRPVWSLRTPGGYKLSCAMGGDAGLSGAMRELELAGSWCCGFRVGGSMSPVFGGNQRIQAAVSPW
jgi:hypothetical protein